MTEPTPNDSAQAPGIGHNGPPLETPQKVAWRLPEWSAQVGDPVRATVNNWINAGMVEAYRCGGLLLIVTSPAEFIRRNGIKRGPGGPPRRKIQPVADGAKRGPGRPRKIQPVADGAEQRAG